MNELEQIGKELAQIGLPLLGAALPFPGGAALGAALAHYIGTPGAKPADILAKIKMDSAAAEKAREFEAQHQTTLLQITVNAEIERDKQDTAREQAVNATMQSEASSAAGEPLWRRMCGFVVAIGSFVALCAGLYLAYALMHVPAAPAGAVSPTASMVAMLPALLMQITGVLALPASAVGIATWHSGHVDRLKAAGAATAPQTSTAGGA